MTAIDPEQRPDDVTITRPAPETRDDRHGHPAPSAGAPRWYAPAGVIQGFREPAAETRDQHVLRAIGIPYARANRHRPPQLLRELPGGGVIVADEPGPTCPQRPSAAGKKIAPHARPRHHDEHCQHIAITVPDGTPANAKLPVMVWIHGGANVSGGGDLERFNPSQMAAENRVIVASITFRLGAYGFLGGGDDRAEGVPPANLGLMDIQAGVEWIRANIAAFGGDPEQITMFGQSAGAELVLSLIVAAGAEKLRGGGRGVDGEPFRAPFRRAILQSLPFGFLGGRGPMYDAMLEALGPVDAGTSEEDFDAAQARAAKAAEPFKNGKAMPYGVRYGAAPMPEESLFDAAVAAVAPDIDILAGYTPREASLFFNGDPEVERLRKLPVVGGALFEAAVRHYTKTTYSESEELAKKWVAAGGSALHYMLTWGAKSAPYRSAHTCDLPLLLGDENAWRDSVLIEGQMWTDVRRDRRAMQAVWTQFAKTGGVARSVLECADFLKVRTVG